MFLGRCKLCYLLNLIKYKGQSLALNGLIFNVGLNNYYLFMFLNSRYIRSMANIPLNGTKIEAFIPFRKKK